MSNDPSDKIGQLYDRWADRLYAVARRWLAHAAEAEDAVQDVFVGLLRLPPPAEEAAYLFTALRHALARRWRDRERRRQVGSEAAALLLATTAETPDPDPELSRAVACLPAEQRLVLTLKIEGGLTFAEIAATCQISANTAASRYRYALENLRDRLRHRKQT